MKMILITAIFSFFSATAAADMISLKQHATWEKKVFSECSKISLVLKQVKCQENAEKKREDAGLLRGTKQYVDTQFAKLTDAQIKQQIKLDEAAMKKAPVLAINADLGELTTDDFQTEINAAKELLSKRTMTKNITNKH